MRRDWRGFVQGWIERRASSRRRYRRLTIERLESRTPFDAAGAIDFVHDIHLDYALSELPADFGQPIAPVYKDFFDGGTYLAGVFTGGMSFDGNDPDAGAGRSSWRATLDGDSGWFEFHLQGAIRELAEFGEARALRLMAKGDAAGQQLRVVVLRNLDGGGIDTAANVVLNLTTTWAEYVVPLPAGIQPSDLRGLQFMTGPAYGLNRGQGTFRLDEVRLSTDGFDPLRLPQSYQPIGWAASGRDATVFPNRAFLYDMALTIKALLADGRPESRALAGQIASAVLATVQADGSYFDERPSGHVLDGSGNPRLPLDEESRRSLGDNAWLGMALVDLYRASGNEAYLTAARRISDWAETALRDPSPLKGYRGGLFNDAVAPWRSVEQNSDLHGLHYQLSEVLAARQDPAAATYLSRARWAGDFVIAMFDAAEGKFWTGTSTGDTFNTESVPLDAQTWPGLALPLDPFYAAAIDWSRPLTWVEANLSAAEGSYTGVTFGTLAPRTKVWFEGTAQLAVAYAFQGAAAKYATTRDAVRHAVENHPNGDGRGLVAASSDNLVDTYFDIPYDARLHLGATSWYVFAEHGLNPFQLVAESAAPRVAGVYARAVGNADGGGGDEWTQAFRDHLAALGEGDAALGYRVSRGPGQLDSLPWTKVDTLSVQFTRGVAVEAGDLTLVAAPEGPAVPTLASFSYDAATATGTWKFTAALGATKYLLHFAEHRVSDGLLSLDGEWTDGAAGPSGNGAPGGAFHFRLNLLPGDANGGTVQSLSVSNDDVLSIKQQLGAVPADGPGYAYRRDLNGSGSVTNADVLLAKQRLSQEILSHTDPTPPPPAPGLSSLVGWGESVTIVSAAPPEADPASGDLAEARGAALADHVALDAAFARLGSGRVGWRRAGES